MTYEETMTRLKEMESRYQDGFSSLDRSLLDSLYFNIFGREITNRGCSDCYRDAYMEILIYLKRNKAMPKKSDFVLKPGAIITFFGEPKCYSNANITDEAALRFLAMNPSNEKLFEHLPEGWKSRLPKSDTPEVEDKDAVIARLTKENEQLRKENEDLKSSAPRKKGKKKSEPEPDPAPAAEASADEPPTETAPEEAAVETAETPDPSDADEVSIEEPEEAPDQE
jgi:hypothetical protein